MGKIDIIIERLKSAPPEVVDEIYALMEKLGGTRSTPAAPSGKGILRHFGALKDSKALEGDPVEIQRAMRDEWN